MAGRQRFASSAVFLVIRTEYFPGECDNQALKEDVTPFECQHQVVRQPGGQHAKTIYCVRAYRDYAGLYDVLYLAASLDQQQQGLISHYTLSGVSQETAQVFNQKFSGAVSWQ